MFFFQDVSRSPSILSLKGGERFIVELKKSSGSLGISVAVSELLPKNINLTYCISRSKYILISLNHLVKE